MAVVAPIPPGSPERSDALSEAEGPKGGRPTPILLHNFLEKILDRSPKKGVIF
jgi:hypothetical protein